MVYEERFTFTLVLWVELFEVFREERDLMDSFRNSTVY